MHESQTRQPKSFDEELVLIHAGRFTGSRLTQFPRLLLEPLLKNLFGHPVKGVIQLIGSLSEDELKLIEPFKHVFRKLVAHRVSGNMPRTKLLELLPKADGLLLLSASYAAFQKLFEYIQLAGQC